MISVIIKSPTPAGQGNGRSSWPRGLILAPTRELVQQIFDEVCVCVCLFHTRATAAQPTTDIAPSQALHLDAACGVLHAT